jgi:hypothetical protein
MCGTCLLQPLIYEQLKVSEADFDIQYYHRILEEKYPECGTSPQQLSQYGLKLIGDQAAKILSDGNRKLELVIGYAKNIDDTLRTLSNYLIQGKKKNVKKAISRLSHATDTAVQERLQAINMNDDEDDYDEDTEEKYAELDDVDEIEETDMENLNPNTSSSPSQYSLAGDVRINKRKRVTGILNKQLAAAKQSSANKIQRK